MNRPEQLYWKKYTEKYFSWAVANKAGVELYNNHPAYAEKFEDIWEEARRRTGGKGFLDEIVHLLAELV